VRITGWSRAALATVILGAGGGVASASTAPPPLRASCELGTVSKAAGTAENAVLKAAVGRFDQGLTELSRAGRTTAARLYATDLAAYVYGYPIVIVRRTILTFPRNLMVSIGKLADTSTVTVVAPNHDTLYSVAQLDLTNGPVVIHTPPTHGRYSVIQLLDAFTNIVSYLGDGAAARTGETAAIAPPGWHGSLPAGVHLVHSATRLVWLLGRTLATGPADTATATALLSQYSLQTLPSYVAGVRSHPTILPEFPRRQPVKVPSGTAFFDELGSDLGGDPPPVGDACALRTFAAAGVGPGRTASGLTGLKARAIAAAASDGQSVLNQIIERVRHLPAMMRNGWATTPPDTAMFTNHYLDRALVARIGLGANTNSKALYMTEDQDSEGRALTGAHSYTVHFAPGRLPPVGQFWSLTLYDRRILFYANSLNRYAVGDRSAGLRRDSHGGLTIYVSHRDPGGKQRRNWLPAPSGSFSLYLRLYEPKSAAVSGRWLPPSVVRSS